MHKINFWDVIDKIVQKNQYRLVDWCRDNADPNPIPTEDMCETFNSLRCDILLIQELYATLSHLEYELCSYQEKYNKKLSESGSVSVSNKVMVPIWMLSTINQWLSCRTCQPTSWTPTSTSPRRQISSSVLPSNQPFALLMSSSGAPFPHWAWRPVESLRPVPEARQPPGPTLARTV